MKGEVRVFKDLEGLSRAAAELFVAQAVQSIRERDHFLTALNGGSTPTRLFQLLASDFRRQVEWKDVHVFWGDERCVPPDDPGSSYGQARQALLRHVPIPEANLHRVKGELGPEDASQDYARVLKEFASPPFNWPRFDLVFLGMGEDGHTASLFPGSPVEASEPTLPVTAHYQDRPANRVTLTPLVFNTARVIAFMAAGEKKVQTFAEVQSDRYNPERYPAQRIAPRDGRLIWLVDAAAAGRLSNEIL